MLFVVEHEIDVIKHADWIVDVEPAAGENGGRVLYSGPPKDLNNIIYYVTRHYIFDNAPENNRECRTPQGWLQLAGISRNNLNSIDINFPMGVYTSVTSVSGSGKSSLVSQVLVELVANHLGLKAEAETDEMENPLEQIAIETTGGAITDGMQHIKRLGWRNNACTIDERCFSRRKTLYSFRPK